jgi:2-deoxy-D-gluconate 3-dehydrogenase
VDFRLAGKSAIVTGASRGLGRAICEALADEGVNVLGAARPSENLHSLEKHGSGRIQAIACDVTESVSLARLPEEAVKRFGRLDLVVNNAGGQVIKPFHELSPEDWMWHFAINVHSAATLSRAAAPYFFAQRAGKVINMASTAGIKGVANLVGYCTVKGAVIQFTRALATEWAGKGVQVNAIGAGTFLTDLTPEILRVPGKARDDRLAKIPDGRQGLPAELGPLACYLASPLSDHVTGALLMIDGGETMRL